MSGNNKLPCSTEWTDIRTEYNNIPQQNVVEYSPVLSEVVTIFLEELIHAIDEELENERKYVFKRCIVSKFNATYVYRSRYRNDKIRIVFDTTSNITSKVEDKCHSIIRTIMTRIRPRDSACLHVQMKVANRGSMDMSYNPGLEIGWSTKSIVYLRSKRTIIQRIFK